MANELKIRKLRSPETGPRAVLKNRDWESKNVEFLFAREKSKKMVNELKIRKLRSPEKGPRAVLKIFGILKNWSVTAHGEERPSLNGKWAFKKKRKLCSLEQGPRAVLKNPERKIGQQWHLECEK